MEELQEQSIAAAVRALARCPDLEVKYHYTNYGQLDGDVDGDGVLALPHIEELSVLRGVGDVTAMRLLYHDEVVHRRFRPDNMVEARVYDVAEASRLESLGLLRFKGMWRNVEAREVVRGEQVDVENDADRFVEAIRFMVRKALVGDGMSIPTVLQDVISQWELLIGSKVGDSLLSLSAVMEDQVQFAERMVALIAMMDVGGKAESGKGEGQSSEADPLDSVAPGDFGDMQGIGMDVVSDAGVSTEVHVSASLGDDVEVQEETGDAYHGRNWLLDDGDGIFVGGYRVYSTQYDEVVGAEGLSSIEELTRLRGQLDQKLEQVQDVSRRLAARLRSQLLAQQHRAWEFHQEEGFLDAARLATVIADPNYPFYYKAHRPVEQVDTVVSLLIDNSGSMRGRPITVAALSADILARTLEQCGVRVEILGFTTKEWKGGAVRKLWQEAGSPAGAGRLNDLRHIVYKSADQPWRRARRNLGLMLKDGILKENIDGEALLWAHDRLMARPEERKLLMVISDGAPVDDSTLSANDGAYLDRHLREVITVLQCQRSLELLAIGIGHDVTRYYDRAVTIQDVEQLGEVMFREVAGLFGS